MAEDKTELLARELNIVERLVIPKTTVTSSSSRTDLPKRSKNSTRHLIAIKFQTTSKKDDSSSSSSSTCVTEEEEIIDFAAVVVSLETENIVAAFHQYVMPTGNSSNINDIKVSRGIEKVDNGVPLKTCLMLYSNWLKKLEKDIGLKLPSKQDPKNPVTIPVTWSDWDLGKSLPMEARKKRLIYLKHLESWMDLRSLWIKNNNQIPENLKDAIIKSKLKWKEKKEISLQYAINIANLAMAMHEKGQEFQYTSMT